MTESVRNFQTGAYDLKDAVTLDVRAVMASIPGLGERYYVQSVRGLTQIHGSEPVYRVSISGTGLGIPSERIRSTIRLELNGSVVAEVVTQRTDPHTTRFEIPSKVLEPHFAPSQMKRLEGAFLIRHEHRTGLLDGVLDGLIPRWRAREYRVPLFLALMPRYAGRITAEAEVPVYAWRPIQALTEERVTHNHHCRSRCRGEPTRTPYDITIKVRGVTPPEVGSRRLTMASITCAEGPCAFSHSYGTTLTEDNTRATGRFDVWSHPMRWTLRAEAEEYQRASNRRDSTEHELAFDRILELVVPSDATVTRISGQTVTGRKFEFIAGANEPGGLLRLEREIPPAAPGVPRRFYYRVVPPALPTP
jgi:hypothetical protein